MTGDTGQQLMNLHGKTALITGSAVRVGRALALRIAEAGCNVVVHYGASKDAALETVAQITALGVNAQALSADLGDIQQVGSIIGQAQSLSGSLDVLINNASIFPVESFEGATADSWDGCMDVNLKAPFLLSQGFAAQIQQGQQGKIVNILDASSLRPQDHHFSYTVSKYALDGLTRAVAHSLAGRNIQVNGVALGAILPNSNDHDPEAFEQLAGHNPSLRNGHPGDVCNAMMYLLQHADYVTGETIRVDGGQHLV